MIHLIDQIFNGVGGRIMMSLVLFMKNLIEKFTQLGEKAGEFIHLMNILIDV